MKRNKILKIITVFLSVFLIILLIITFYLNRNAFNVSNLNNTLPYNINELLKKDYGKSKYRMIKGGVIIDIERILNEKYFITYSWMSGNQSSFYIVFLVENENKNPISNHKVNNIKVIDNMGMEYKTSAFFFEDYPIDEPLKYKQTLNVKFLPFNENVKSITVTFNYLGNDYIFKNIPI